MTNLFPRDLFSSQSPSLSLSDIFQIHGIRAIDPGTHGLTRFLLESAEELFESDTLFPVCLGASFLLHVAQEVLHAVVMLKGGQVLFLHPESSSSQVVGQTNNKVSVQRVATVCCTTYNCTYSLRHLSCSPSHSGTVPCELWGCGLWLLQFCNCWCWIADVIVTLSPATMMSLGFVPCPPRSDHGSPARGLDTTGAALGSHVPGMCPRMFFKAAENRVEIGCCKVTARLRFETHCTQSVRGSLWI